MDYANLFTCDTRCKTTDASTIQNTIMTIFMMVLGVVFAIFCLAIVCARRRRAQSLYIVANPYAQQTNNNNNNQNVNIINNIIPGMPQQAYQPPPMQPQYPGPPQQYQQPPQGYQQPPQQYGNLN